MKPVLNTEQHWKLTLTGWFPRTQPCVLRTFQTKTKFTPHSCEAGAIIPILQMRKSRSREVGRLAQGHTAPKWRRQDLSKAIS